MARTNSIASLKFTKMVLNRFVFLAVCLLFFIVNIIGTFTSHGALASTEEEGGMPTGTVLAQYSAKNKVIIGMISSTAASSSASSAAMHPGDVNNGSKTTILNGANDQDTSMFVVDTGNSGILGTTATGGGQNAVIDRYFSLPQSAITMLAKPAVGARVNNYTSGKEIKIDYGSNKANKAAVIRLELGKASNVSAFTVYPCDESPANRGSLFSSKTKIQSTTMFADTGSGSAVCIKGSANTASLIVETYGFANWNLDSPKPLLTMIQDDKKASINQVVTVNTGVPNKIALLQVSGVSASKGYVEAYTTQKGNKGQKALYLESGSKDTVMIPVYTGTDGKVSLKSNVSAGYSVNMVGSITGGEAGINLTKYAGPKTLEDTKDGYPGKGLLLLSSSGKLYIRPYQVVDMKCDSYDYGGTKGWKTFSFKVRGLDPDLPGSTREADDQGSVAIRTKDFQIEGATADPNTYDYYDTYLANGSGVARVSYGYGSEHYTAKVNQFYGKMTFDTYRRYWFEYDKPIAGTAVYQVSLPKCN